MAVEITMPQLSDTMSEGRILVWKKKEGDEIKRGDALAEVATDKADLEIESFHQGKLLKILSNVGDTVKVGSVIAVIGDASENVSTPSAATAPAQAPVTPKPEVAKQPAIPVAAATPPPTYQSPVPQPEPVSASAPSERVKISPLAKNYALNQGVDFTQIQGSGEGGRIVRRDVEQFLGNAPAAPVQSQPISAPSTSASPAPVQSRPYDRAPAPMPQIATGAGTQELSKMRQAISSRMVESKTTIPHFYMTSKIGVEGLSKLRETIKPLPQYEGITYNHLIIKAVGLALKAVPRINAAYQNGSMHQPSDVNVGIVTAVQDGLLIPVLKRADQLPLSDIVQEAKGLVQRARAGRPKADDLMGGTFSISNVGPYPVESFSAIISPGQGGILAVSAIQEEPVVKEGKVVPGLVMRVTLSVDHRIIDGVIAGEFLKEFKRLIEEPVLLLA